VSLFRLLSCVVLLIVGVVVAVAAVAVGAIGSAFVVGAVAGVVVYFTWPRHYLRNAPDELERRRVDRRRSVRRRRARKVLAVLVFGVAAVFVLVAVTTPAIASAGPAILALIAGLAAFALWPRRSTSTSAAELEEVRPDAA
jgi:membrane associated rhomboid family serine protease